jgi:hypothetical protein
MRSFRRSSITRLFLRHSPSTISRLIISVVVNAVDGMLRTRRPSHVFEEIFVRIKPSIADSNSPSAISVIVLAFSVVAALLYAAPCTIFLCSIVGIAEMAFAMRSGRQAAATLGMTSKTFQMGAANSYGCAAFTTANPPTSPSINCEVAMKNCKAGENLSSKVYTLHGCSASCAVQSWRRVFEHPSPFVLYGTEAAS